MEKMKSYVLDTNILMSTENYEKLFADFEGDNLIILSTVIEELDNIKTREGMPGFQARRAIKAIKKYSKNFTFLFENSDTGFSDKKADNVIINAAADSGSTLLTNDINVQLKAQEYFGIEPAFYNQQKKTINSGYHQIEVTTKEFQEQKFDLPELPYGMYLLIKTKEDNSVKVYKSFGEGQFEAVVPQKLGCNYLGAISPRDPFQICAIDSMIEDNFSIITGPAGSGKTLISLTYALREIQSHKRRKLIIFCNPVKTRGSEQLGFYTGSRTEKLIQNSIGAILASKLGDMEGVQELMEQGKLEILPISDIRGYEVGRDDIMYITEAQNLNVELIKLAIQRCAEGTKIILEGDPCTQVDHYSFEGDGNGLVRAIEVFEGFYGFSHVNLPNIYRSAIADRAELM